VKKPELETETEREREIDRDKTECVKEIEAGGERGSGDKILQLFHLLWSE